MDTGGPDFLGCLHPDVGAWFSRRHGGPTPAQALALPALLSGEHLLVSSPTGTGKTLAAFLGILSRLHEDADAGGLASGVHAVYVSPLKALVTDMGRNLQEPLEGVAALRRASGRPDAGIRVALRTGDTPPSQRARQRRQPPHALATTPESLALLLASSSWRDAFRPLRWIVVDEVHALASSKRGTHLAVGLERLEALAGQMPVRIGLSATVAPLPRVARFLAGDRPCRIVEARPPKAVALDVAYPVDDPLAHPEDTVEEATFQALARAVAAHRTTLVFTNTRASAEALARGLQARHGDADGGVDPEAPWDPAFVAPHHGSMSQEARVAVEDRLKRQEIRCVVASASLELGIHVDGVDHVVLVGSPKASSRALQRVGRSGHRMGGRSRGTLLARDPAEALEGLALADLVAAGAVEEVAIPPGAPDVLAQHLVGLAVAGMEDASAAFALVRRADPYRDLPREVFDRVLGVLDGLRLLTWDRARDRFAPRSGRARILLLKQGGTIPASGLVKVFEGPRWVGEVEEAFVESLQPGDVFQLAGETWAFLRAVGLRCEVRPARGSHPTVPAWRSEGLALSPLLARRTTQRVNELQSNLGNEMSLIESHVCRWVALQGAFAGVPGPDEVAVEACPSDEGGGLVVFHHRRGRRINDAIARAAAHRLGELQGVAVRAQGGDEGFALHVSRRLRPTRALLHRLFDAPLAEALRADLVGSDLLRRRFRHVATRGFLLTREDVPLSRLQREANGLLGRLLREDPTHPYLEEAFRECLEEAMDLPGAEADRQRIATGDLPLRLLPRRPSPSPFAARILAPTGPRGRDVLRDLDERARDWVAMDGKGR